MRVPYTPLDLIHDTIGLCVKLCHGVILMGCPAAYVTTVTGYCHFKVTDTWSQVVFRSWSLHGWKEKIRYASVGLLLVPWKVFYHWTGLTFVTQILDIECITFFPFHSYYCIPDYWHVIHLSEFIMLHFNSILFMCGILTIAQWTFQSCTVHQ